MGPARHPWVRESKLAIHKHLILLDQRVGEQALAHLRQRSRVADLELDQPSDPHCAHAIEPERREGALGCRPLRVEDAGLGTNEDARVHLNPC